MVSPVLLNLERNIAVDVAQLLSFTVKNNASDLNLPAGAPPMIRVDGDIKRVNMPALSHKDVNSMVYDIMNDKQRKNYEEFLETDFSFEIPKLALFRVNAFNQNRGSAVIFRIMPSEILTLENLGAPAIFKDISMHPRGIVLVMGPTGSGKSTTMATMVHYNNDNKPDHISTIEDPIKFVHQSKKSLINQREVYRDTLGFNEALRSALREDPTLSWLVSCVTLKPFAPYRLAPKQVTPFSECCTRNHDRYTGDQKPDPRGQD